MAFTQSPPLSNNPKILNNYLVFYRYRCLNVINKNNLVGLSKQGSKQPPKLVNRYQNLMILFGISSELCAASSEYSHSVFWDENKENFRKSGSSVFLKPEIIAYICQLWYTTVLFSIVKVHQRVQKSSTKYPKLAKNRPKFCVHGL